MLRLSSVVLLLTGPALAEPAEVVTDIPPLATLVASVQDGRGSVKPLADATVDPHHASMRVSQARALSEADLAIWVGPELSPWFGTALESLAPDTPARKLAETAPVVLDWRAASGGHDAHADHDADEHDHAASDGHDDHDAHDHHDADEHDDHAHGRGSDPHMWLSPRNAAAWTDTIAAALTAVDPDGAEHYQRAAAQTAARITAQASGLRDRFAALGPITYMAGHDSFQYAEDLTGAVFAGAVSDSHATAPGPAHLAALRDRATEGGVDCVVAAAESDGKLLDQFAADTGLPLVTVDPLAAAPDFPTWMQAFYDAFAKCAPGSDQTDK